MLITVCYIDMKDMQTYKGANSNKIKEANIHSMI